MVDLRESLLAGLSVAGAVRFTGAFRCGVTGSAEDLPTDVLTTPRIGLPINLEAVGISTTSTDFLAFFLARGLGDSYVVTTDPAITVATSEDRFLRLADADGFGVVGLPAKGTGRSC